MTLIMLVIARLIGGGATILNDRFIVNRAIVGCFLLPVFILFIFLIVVADGRVVLPVLVLVLILVIIIAILIVIVVIAIILFGVMVVRRGRVPASVVSVISSTPSRLA